MIRHEIEQLLAKALSVLGYESADMQVSFPKDIMHGDFMTSLPLALGKKMGESPMEVAEKIRSKILESKPDFLAVVEVAAPGFINFTLAPGYFAGMASDIAEQKENWGKSEIHKGKIILVEHSSPNLFKPFHIGHVMNNAIGESIKRLATFSGAQVFTVSYPSDISLGIAKAIFILIEKHVEDGHIYKPSIPVLGDAYAEGTKRYDEDPLVQDRIKEISKNLFSKTPSKELDVYEICKNFNIEYFKDMTSRLGSHFDAFIYESQAGKEGEEIVRKNTPNIFKESEGAVIYEGEKDGLHTRVFINKEGHPTYEAKDLGLLSLKFKEYKPDISLFVTDHEQTEYFKVVSTAAGKINKDWQDKTIHRTHGRMSFKGAKMSSRLGGVTPAQELLDTLEGELKIKSENLNERAISQISVAALKFPILRAMAGRNIDFDPETSLSFLGATGPYLQYAVVRAGSILAKSDKRSLALPEGWQTTQLEKLLVRFPEIVERATSEWEPHHVAGYLLELAQAFNTWYASTQILGDDDASSPYKLALTEAFKTTLENGLYLLGMEVPEKM